jgi:AraC family transcriptional regulator, L-rhamnose operon regulatory protein RhaS
MRLKTHEYFASLSEKLAIYTSDPEDNNKEHCHEFDELVIVKSGHGLHVINSQPLFIKTGDVFYVKKDEYHFYDELGTLKLINILINPDVDFNFIKNTEPLLSKLTSDSLNDYAWLDNAGLAKATDISKILFIKKDDHAHAATLKLEQEALFLQLITLIFEYKHTISDNTEHKINKILKFVQNDCFSEVNWNALSEQFEVPLRTLFRHLKEKTGMTPENYLKRLRLISARKKIRETDITITNIAFDCGFSNSNHFATAYKNVFGISPSTERVNYIHVISHE